MLGVGNFLDTNILMYAFTHDARAVAAQRLLAEPFIVSVQALNEFANVGRRKLGLTWSQIDEALQDLAVLADRIIVLDQRITLSAVHIADRYRLSFYDAAMIAAALEANCTHYYSEDLHHGLKVDDRLEIVNPFR